jgi:type VI secretion system protein ImpM
MSEMTTPQESIGLYGKLPVFGDFVVRQLKSEFVSSWDGWLQEGLANSRQLLGDSWLETYMLAPIWRFIIGPGILGGNAWMGIMLPSVDRVGRYFPLTLALPVSPQTDIAQTYLTNGEWFRAIEDLGMDALKQGLDFKEYEARLSRFPVPACVCMQENDDTIPLNTTIPEPTEYLASSYARVPQDDNFKERTSQIRNAISGALKPVSLWGAEFADTQEHLLLATESLPDKEIYCALLDRNFEAHGWIDITKR